MRLDLFEPDIRQNLGALIRLAAGLGVPLVIIGPCGFPLDDKRIRRAAMDYVGLARIVRHASWQAFMRDRAAGRLVLLTTSGAQRFPDVAFRTDDTLLLGRESAGVPAEVHDAADLRVRIPLQKGLRSLHVAPAGARVCEGWAQRRGGWRACSCRNPEANSGGPGGTRLCPRGLSRGWHTCAAPGGRASKKFPATSSPHAPGSGAAPISRPWCRTT